MHDAKVQHLQFRIFFSPQENEQYRALCERLDLPADRITQEHRNSREWQIGMASVVGWPLVEEILASPQELEIIQAYNELHETEIQAERERWVDEEVEEAHAEVEEALDRFRADQQEGLEVLGRADADRLRRENEELRAEIRRLKTERAKNLAARAVDAQYRPNVTGRTNEVKPDEWPVFAAPAYPDRDDDAILARFDFHSVDMYRRLRMDTVRSRFRGLAAFLLAFTPDGRYRNLALTKLEEAMFFANKGIAMEGR